ncbi:helix-turn-helix domain-containing protein [Rathayibacter sp. SD072]|uniref:ArsR/SmtB family transcription factor n=1 Tax=Rathayibacter sp. SD072 TaxID=2781731 RepID=UPI001A9668CF|nr:helix-turn-helix domain-containing protein [Rathayibacter sp. SD072]MBO0984699.1 winged helix-turn-helix transcriptional regulator [Rathayibacter sp. SD072]
MVVDVEDDERIDRVFRALADATRRDIVARVLQSEQSVSVLASEYAMSFAAVQKHVAVLERASLVRKRRSGREQLVSGEVEALQRAARLLDAYEELWRGRVDRITGLLAEEGRQPTAEPRRGSAR